VVALIVGTSPAWALPIAGVTVESVSSEYVANGWDLSAIHTVDGSGLSGNPATHAQTVSPGGESWQTISQTGAAQIVFDLGGSYALTSMHIWNLNFYAPYNGRGAHEVALSLSPDLGSWDSKGNFSFSMATGLNGDPGFDISLQQPWETARYVKFDILSNWGGSDNAGHVGLSEVQFFSDTPDPAPVPEPATMLFLGLGLIGLAGAKKSLKINQDKSQ
jgi:hypothetical protein